MKRVRELAGPVAIAFATALVAAGVSCGGTPAPAPPTGPTGGPSDPSTGGGSGSGGSGGDGSGGNTAGGGPDGGSGSPGGATPSGGGTPGGTAGGPDACSGLGATPDAGHALPRDTGTHATCWRATTSADGRLAFGILSPGGQVRFLLYPPDASAQQGEIASLQSNGSTDLDPWFHPTDAGWTGIVHDPPPAVALRAFGGTGAVLGTSRDLVVSSAPDAHGGTVAIASSSTGSPRGAPTLEWFDASGTLLRTAPLDDEPTMLLVEFGNDHVLTLVPASAGLRARWYDGTGTPVTPWFQAGPALDPTRASMHLLLDGTIALGDGTAWRGIFRDGVARIDPAPDWLAARPGTRLATIRGGRGYAVLPMPGGSPGASADQTTFEIVAASGESCGTVTLPAPAAEAGVTRTPTALDVGQDGTVLQTEALGEDRPSTGIHGEFRWWPGLLR